MQRLMLVRHGPTSASQSGRFPVDEPLSPEGRTAAGRLRAALGPAGGGEAQLVCSPALRCRQTAAAAGAADPLIEPRIAEGDFGTWAGQTVERLHREDPAAVTAWMTDPAAAPHGGESLLDVLVRVGGWLEEIGRMREGRTIAVTHAGVIKAAVVHALDAPPQAFWRIAVAPLSRTELVHHGATWEIVTLGAPS